MKVAKKVYVEISQHKKRNSVTIKYYGDTRLIVIS